MEFCDRCHHELDEFCIFCGVFYCSHCERQVHIGCKQNAELRKGAVINTNCTAYMDEEAIAHAEDDARDERHFEVNEEWE